MNSLTFISIVSLLAFMHAATYPNATEDSREKIKCGDHEKLSPCGNRCEWTCLFNLAEGNVSCAQACEAPACSCENGYARAMNKECIPKDQCTNANTCPEHEVVNGCGSKCERKCSDIASGQQPVCPKICDPPACVCATGYARSTNNKCIPENECNQNN